MHNTKRLRKVISKLDVDGIAVNHGSKRVSCRVKVVEEPRQERQDKEHNIQGYLFWIFVSKKQRCEYNEIISCQTGNSQKSPRITLSHERKKQLQQRQREQLSAVDKAEKENKR